ncbi:MAG: hypothetical protein MZV70_10995 [Desulfobacterales bacterium]|nr:hypothetical protein [Desulfobacterales bacterium]
MFNGFAGPARAGTPSRSPTDSVNEIKAMAKGRLLLLPERRARWPMWAPKRDGRPSWTRRATPVDFAVNEKCAAGAGAFIEAMARALEVTIEEMGPLGLQSDKEIPMNAQCAIFAESEVVGLIHSKTAKPDISKAIHDSIASRIVSMIRRIGVQRGCGPDRRAGPQPGLHGRP